MNRYTLAPRLALAAVSLCLFACSEEGIVAPVVSDGATLVVNLAAPTELAEMNIEMGFDVEGPGREIELQSVELYSPAQGQAAEVAFELSAAFPSDFTVDVGPGDERRIKLVNTGTSNADLEPFCGGTYFVVVQLALLVEPEHTDDGEVTIGTGTFADIAIECQQASAK